jgi:hypothetical protein
MSFEYFRQTESSTGVMINSKFVVCYYADPMREETVFIELINGSKFVLKTTLSAVENWLIKSS